jgi:hypothetical protein
MQEREREREQKVAHTDHSDAILTFIDGLSKIASASEELWRRIYFYSMPVGMREIENFHPQQKKKNMEFIHCAPRNCNRVGQQKAPVFWRQELR